MLHVVATPRLIARLREDPEKLLFLGFDTRSRALEVITDSGKFGGVFLIHADFITKKYIELLKEAV